MTPRKTLLFVLVAAALLLTGCGGGRAQVQTDEGPFDIVEVQLSDTFPPDCPSGTPGCSEARSGYTILIVWLDPVNAFEGSLDPAMPAVSPSLTLGDGSDVPLAIHGMADQRYFVAFTPPDSAGSITLNWEGNDPISLDGYLGE